MSELISHFLTNMGRKTLWYAWLAVCVLCLLAGVFMSTSGFAQTKPLPANVSCWNNPEECDWYVLLFFHKEGEVDEEGDPERRLNAGWYTKPGMCEKRMQELYETKPPGIIIDAIVCLPLKKEPNQKRHTKETL